MTASAAATTRAHTLPHRAGGVVTLGGRLKRAVRRRSGRFEWMLIVFVMLLPALVTAGLVGR